MIVEYDVVRSESLMWLIRDVNLCISDGWEPIGGIYTDIESSRTPFMQAMVKRDYSKVS